MSVRNIVKLFSALALVALFAASSFAADYDSRDVEVINAMIRTNGLNAEANAPEKWNFVKWTDFEPKRAVRVNVSARNLTGTLDVSGLDELKELVCGVNRLSGVNVADNSKLSVLQVNENGLEALDVRGNTELTWLWCYGNALTELDLTYCSKLQTLNCSDNDLMSLDITRCPDLRSLSAVHNSFSDLDTTRCPKLTTLWWDGNSR